MFNNPEWSVLDETRLPAVLEAMREAHPDPDRLSACKPRIFLSDAEGDRIMAYQLDENDLPYIIGYFPRSMLLRVDVNHPQAQN